ncbi:uncharacterized protein LOC143192331 isoform X2 [Rhynchophorus ferrugineus]
MDNKVDTRFPQYQKLWYHEAGPRTIFFWAPTVKWGIVLAGIADLTRPPDEVSLDQTLSLAVTGFIWSRYSLVITPVNYNLLSVNLFMSLTQTCQLVRALYFNYMLSPEEQEKIIHKRVHKKKQS